MEFEHNFLRQFARDCRYRTLLLLAVFLSTYMSLADHNDEDQVLKIIYI